MKYLKYVFLCLWLATVPSFGQITFFPPSAAGGGSGVLEELTSSCNDDEIGIVSSGAVTCIATTGTGNVIRASEVGGGSAIDSICWNADQYRFPDVDPAAFTWDGSAVKWPIIKMSIGDEVQFGKKLDVTIGTSPQCYTNWYLPSGGPNANDVRFDCKFSCITDGEDADGRALGSSNPSGNITVPGTATLRSDDTWAADDDFQGCAKNDTMIVEFERLAATTTDITPATDTQHEQFCVSWTN